MDTNRVISALCYFSIFFAGFLFPIAVYFIVDQQEVKDHAKSALLSHLIPFITIPILIIIVILGGEPSFILMFLMFGVFGLINVVILIWNIVRGIKVLRD